MKGWRSRKLLEVVVAFCPRALWSLIAPLINSIKVRRAKKSNKRPMRLHQNRCLSFLCMVIVSARPRARPCRLWRARPVLASGWLGCEKRRGDARPHGKHGVVLKQVSPPLPSKKPGDLAGKSQQTSAAHKFWKTARGHDLLNHRLMNQSLLRNTHGSWSCLL